MSDRGHTNAIPKRDAHDVRRAFDHVERIELAIKGFALLMSTDEARITGPAGCNVEVLLNFLMEHQGNALDALSYAVRDGEGDAFEAFDLVERVDTCLRGFALMMSRDDDRFSGEGAQHVETLIAFLTEQQDAAIAELSNSTWQALGEAQ